jgi:hypothetical protein
MATEVFGEMSWERMSRAVEKVRERLVRVSRVLNSAGIPYVTVGGNAVAAWVSTIDEAAVRNTRDVNIAIRRSDLPKAIEVLEAEGFVYRHVKDIDMFLDGRAPRPAMRSTSCSPAKKSGRGTMKRCRMPERRTCRTTFDSCRSSRWCA